MTELSEKISTVDLPMIMESEGIELHRSGNGYQFKCCFHNDRHPSAGLYNKGNGWRYHCFACQSGGDAVDFIRQRHNFDFMSACRYLGIESGPLSHPQRARAKKNQARRKAGDAFRRWELSAIDELRDTISTVYKISSQWKTVEQFEAGAMILEPISDLQGQLNILMMGTKADRLSIYNRWKRRGWF
jgi:DNA primase